MTSLARFDDFAPELRNAIYEAVLVTDGPLVLEMANYGGLRMLQLVRRRSSLEVNLLAVSRTVRDEATPVLYSANTFHFDSDAGSHFLSMIKLSVKFLRHVQILSLSSPEWLRVACRLLVFDQLESITLPANEMKRGDLVSALHDWAIKTTEARKGTDKPLPGKMLNFVRTDRRPIYNRSLDAVEYGAMIKNLLENSMAARNRLRIRKK